jgi:hypothetical protein
MKRFFDKVLKTDNCWEWIANLNSYNYGTFKQNGKKDLLTEYLGNYIMELFQIIFVFVICVIILNV